MPPGPPPCGASFFSSGMSQTSASVVSSSEAIDDAFWSAERTTFAGSMTPALTRFSYVSVRALSPAGGACGAPGPRAHLLMGMLLWVAS